MASETEWEESEFEGFLRMVYHFNPCDVRKLYSQDITRKMKEGLDEESLRIENLNLEERRPEDSFDEELGKMLRRRKEDVPELLETLFSFLRRNTGLKESLNLFI